MRKLLGSILGVGAAFAEPVEVEAQEHWLFDPVPETEMRELSTDRPDTTESPYSVDAGHLQVETNLANGYVGFDGRWQGHDLMEINAKIGLVSFADLQVVFSTYEERGDDDGNFVGGVGDTTFRLKINLFGNDGGDVAIGLLPMVSVPTGGPGVTAGQAEFGLAVPMGFELPEGFGAGAMVEADAVWGENLQYHPEFLATFTVGHDIAGPFAAFVEITNTTVVDTTTDAQGTVNAGITASPDDNVLLDVGVNVRTWGNASEDVRLFAGATVRN